MEYAYKRHCAMSFPDAVEAVELSVSDHGFVVQERYDIGAALAAKGFPIRPLMILEVAPAEEIDDLVTLILPCRINIYEEKDHAVIAVLRPSLFSAVFPEHELDEIADRFEKRVVELVDGAAGDGARSDEEWRQGSGG